VARNFDLTRSIIVAQIYSDSTSLPGVVYWFDAGRFDPVLKFDEAHRPESMI
jgi:hypothetical protein